MKTGYILYIELDELQSLRKLHGEKERIDIALRIEAGDECIAIK